MRSKAKSDPANNFLGNCPICSTRFTLAMASTIARVAGMKTMYVECGKCASSVIIGVSRNIPGIVTTVGMLTDMKRGDIERLISLPALTTDDVLEIHKCLEMINN